MSSSSALEIACELGELTAPERVREQALLSKFREALGKASETDHGFRFTVPAEPLVLSELGEFIAYERRCCPFLTFELSAPPKKGPVTLHVFGDSGAKEFIKTTFSLSS